MKDRATKRIVKSKYDRNQGGLESMVYTFIDKEIASGMKLNEWQPENYTSKWIKK